MRRIYAKVDLDAIRSNMINLKSNLKPDAKVMAVVKADGYGLGAVPVAKSVQDLVCGFAVATAEEGLNLRFHGLTGPVLVLGYVPEEQFGEVIDKEIRCAAFSYPEVKKLSDEAVRRGKKAIIHLKIDTGMGRIGVKPEDAPGFARACASLPGIVTEGIFTHLATADMADYSPSLVQEEKFKGVLSALEAEGLLPPMVHCGNSAATIWLPDTPGEIFREGISLYGYYPSDEPAARPVKLTPALSLHSMISFIKEVDGGTPIGYGGTYVTAGKTRVATVPTGYADGYPRSLSSKGKVLIRGVYCPIIGRVCMDQFMVDVTAVPEASVRDEVVLIGKSGDKEITLEDICLWSGGFHYELLCLLGRRVPRIYTRNGREIGEKDYFHDEYPGF